MKKYSLLLLTALLSISGCKKNPKTSDGSQKEEITTNSMISESIEDSFDEESSEEIIENNKLPFKDISNFLINNDYSINFSTSGALEGKDYGPGYVKHMDNYFQTYNLVDDALTLYYFEKDAGLFNIIPALDESDNILYYDVDYIKDNDFDFVMNNFFEVYKVLMKAISDSKYAPVETDLGYQILIGEESSPELLVKFIVNDDALTDIYFETPNYNFISTISELNSTMFEIPTINGLDLLTHASYSKETLLSGKAIGFELDVTVEDVDKDDGVIPFVDAYVETNLVPEDDDVIHMIAHRDDKDIEYFYTSEIDEITSEKGYFEYSFDEAENKWIKKETSDVTFNLIYSAVETFKDLLSLNNKEARNLIDSSLTISDNSYIIHNEKDGEISDRQYDYDGLDLIKLESSSTKNTEVTSGVYANLKASSIYSNIRCLTDYVVLDDKVYN